jgi:hypothetical protein
VFFGVLLINLQTQIMKAEESLLIMNMYNVHRPKSAGFVEFSKKYWIPCLLIKRAICALFLYWKGYNRRGKVITEQKQ